MKILAKRIHDFLDKYASINPNYKYGNGKTKYTSPDAYSLLNCADMLNHGQIPKRCWSKWSSEGYEPYSTLEGREEHDYLVRTIYTLISHQ